MNSKRFGLVNNTGILSEKNICFVNVIVQLLYSIPKVKDYFKLKEFQHHHTKVSQLSVCNELSRIFNYTGNSNASAAVLRNIIARKSGKNYLRDGSQQDAMEFFVTLLEVIKSEMAPKDEGNTGIDGFWGLEKFEKSFVVSNDGSCSKCKLKPRDEIESFNVIQLSVPKTNNVLLLSKLIQDYLCEYTSDTEMKCDCCKHESLCPLTGDCKPKLLSRRRLLLKAPEFMVIQLNRFSLKDMSKICSVVWAEDIVQLPIGEQFKLCAIGHRSGDSQNNGHY